jgi:hypothetical protein
MCYPGLVDQVTSINCQCQSTEFTAYFNQHFHLSVKVLTLRKYRKQNFVRQKINRNVFTSLVSK